MAAQRAWKKGLVGGADTVACIIAFQSVTASACARPAPRRSDAATIGMQSRLWMHFIEGVLSWDREFPFSAPATRRNASEGFRITTQRRRGVGDVFRLNPRPSRRSEEDSVAVDGDLGHPVVNGQKA